MDQEAKIRALQKLAMLESSGGKFRSAPVVNQGVQEGTHAVSSYGLMPNTVYEMAQKNKDFGSTPAGQQILQTGGDPNKINQITADPNNDKAAAGALWDYNQSRLAPYVPPDQLEKAGVLAHRRGVTGALNSIVNNGQDPASDPYVKQYLNIDDPSQDNQN